MLSQRIFFFPVSAGSRNRTASVSYTHLIVGSEYINADKYLQDIVRDKRYWEGKRQTIRQREKHMEAVSYTHLRCFLQYSRLAYTNQRVNIK